MFFLRNYPVLFILTSLICLNAGAADGELERFRQGFEKAIKSRNTDTIKGFFYLKNVPIVIESLLLDNIDVIKAAKKIGSTRVIDYNPQRETSQNINGIELKHNLKPVKTLILEYFYEGIDKPIHTSFLVGKHRNKYLITLVAAKNEKELQKFNSFKDIPRDRSLFIRDENIRRQFAQKLKNNHVKFKMIKRTVNGKKEVWMVWGLQFSKKMKGLIAELKEELTKALTPDQKTPPPKN